MMKRGFTIVELMMVIGIIGVLMGIVTTAASSSVRQARIRKADMLCKLVQTGLETYHAQHNKWPVDLESKTPENDDVNKVELSASDVRACVLEMVKEAKKGNPPMDISGLYVSRSSSSPRNDNCRCGECGGTRYLAAQDAIGLDFMQAVRGTPRSKKKMSSSEMYFGYPHPESGKFMPFRMSYSIPGDSITVYQWHWPTK